MNNKPADARDSFEKMMDELFCENFKHSNLAAQLLSDISTLILDKRLELGLSQKELSDKLGVSQSMLSRYESGRCNPTVQKLAEMLYQLGINAHVIEAQDVKTNEEHEWLKSYHGMGRSPYPRNAIKRQEIVA